MLPKLSRRFYNAVIQTLSNCIGLETKHFTPDTSGFQLTNGQVYAVNRVNSKSRRSESSNLNISDGHLNTVQGDAEHIMVDEDISRELINDIICDNIVLKNRLEKVVVETANVKTNLEEIGNRVKEINDICDILLSEKIDSQGKNGASNHSKITKSKNTLLYP